MLPTYRIEPYNDSLTNKDRFDLVKDWLSLPDSKRPSLLGIYISTVDTVGHKFGPNSKEVLIFLLSRFLNNLDK